jgi:hypothetical protein
MFATVAGLFCVQCTRTFTHKLFSFLSAVAKITSDPANMEDTNICILCGGVVVCPTEEERVE